MRKLFVSAPRLVCSVLVIFATLQVTSPAQGDQGEGNAPAQPLRVGIKPIVPFVMDKSLDSPPQGLSIDLWRLISEKIGRKTEFVWLSTVGELLAAVEAEEVDVAIAAITINADREQRVDLSHAYFRSGLRIALPETSTANFLVLATRYISFDLLVLFGALIAITFVTANLLWLAEHKKNSCAFPPRYSHGVWEAAWWSISTIITGGCENKAPETFLGRCVAIAWMLGSIILVATLTATLASKMTVAAVNDDIRGPNSLAKRRVATVAGTAVVTMLEERNAWVVGCENLEEAFRLCREGSAAAVVFDEPTLEYLQKNKSIRDFRLIGPVFEPQEYGIAVASNSPLREIVNQAILELTENGELGRLKLQWLGTLPQ